MEGLSLMAFNNVFSGKRVLITGHTGFKGSWLCEWLLELGAKVVGFSLPLQPHEKLFTKLNLALRIEGDEQGDIADLSRICHIIRTFRPEFVFHLAAQPIVRTSYQIPVQTFATNVMGTIHLLEAVRIAAEPCTVIAVTTDKCYENREWLHSYREEDPLGGHDPYSASKGCAELAIQAYRKSFFFTNDLIRLASVRAGNVIGGGDWAPDRIVPDCIRTLSNGGVIQVRNKNATRPWQHVLEPLSGYLWLAAVLHDSQHEAVRKKLASAFNFGPPLASNRTVADLVIELLKHWQGTWNDQTDPASPHEANLLNLSIDKAHHLLKWSPTWGFERTVLETAHWYIRDAGDGLGAEVTREQLQKYSRDAAQAGQRWAMQAAASDLKVT
jgi:CDP-glucose 4,6-dehydratase